MQIDDAEYEALLRRIGPCAEFLSNAASVFAGADWRLKGCCDRSERG